jgi:hypothetical protein
MRSTSARNRTCISSTGSLALPLCPESTPFEYVLGKPSEQTLELAPGIPARITERPQIPALV